jgi:hypothetical protein
LRMNGADQDAVIDTGAGFSTITRSVADRLGVALLDEEVSVTSGSREEVKTQLGMLDTLNFGDAVLMNVVFIVVPDEALSFSGGAYTINAIIGLPVFLELKRLEFVRGKDSESLIYGPGAGNASGRANMLLDGVEPMVLPKSDRAAPPLRLFIDTGGARTLLYASALKTR